jgi:hypothetical protein
VEEEERVDGVCGAGARSGVGVDVDEEAADQESLFSRFHCGCCVQEGLVWAHAGNEYIYHNNMSSSLAWPCAPDQPQVPAFPCHVHINISISRTWQLLASDDDGQN